MLPEISHTHQLRVEHTYGRIGHENGKAKKESNGKEKVVTFEEGLPDFATVRPFQDGLHSSEWIINGEPRQRQASTTAE